MKKRKKGPSETQRKKLAAAHARHEFFARLKNLCKVLGVAEVYDMIPLSQHDALYGMRFQSPRVLVAEGAEVAIEVLNDVRKVYSEIYKSFMVAVLKNGPEISLLDYVTVHQTLIHFSSLTKNKDSDLAHKDAITKVMTPFVDYYASESENKAILMQAVMLTVSEIESDIRSVIYWLCFDQIIDNYNGKMGVYSFIYIHSHAPEKKNFIIDQVSRPAIRIGWGMPGKNTKFTYVNLPAEKIRSDIKFNHPGFNVYIQSHALQRLIERLDGLMPGSVYFALYLSVTVDLEIQWDKKGNLLLAMFIWGKKVGYLFADIFDSSVVIRSFLFLTYCGTPEGDKLLALTGLAKEDTKYLQIDKLSTFLVSDIHSNQKVKDIFIQVGCGSLFELDKGMLMKHSSDNTKPKADMILEYLGLNKPDDNYEDYEEDTDDS